MSTAIKVAAGVVAGVGVLAGVAYVAYNKGYEDGMEPVPSLTPEELADASVENLLDEAPVTTTE